jgi:hypothetical protein
LETVDLIERETEVFERLNTELYDWWKPESFDPLLDPDDTREETEVSPETIEQLRALGYLQ